MLLEPLDSSVLLPLYERMLLIRRFEEKAGQLYSMGEICGFCHLYIGQEAVAVGLEYCLGREDSIITSYRDHGMMLARGSSPDVMMAELLGKSSGCSAGKGGSMHMFDPERNFFGGHGIVGSQVSLGTGIAFAEKYRGSKAVVASCFGDGAVNQGQVYESFNMAALWKLPVLYVVENNMYAMGSSVESVCANPSLSNRGESFGIPGYSADGMDLMDVIRVTMDAVEHVRNGNGPVLVEYKTYRFKGHSMSDPAFYRSKEEVCSFKKRDPLKGVEALLLQAGVLSSELERVQKVVKEQVSSSVAYARASTFPCQASLMTDIYSE
ncbi:pyruvate dehydrogenase (acetyl-transferring) E1 component subunit alpha [Neorickettsia sp. 179522]|uniref:pyruvate dehydrogenase (acetyl-transferring) E1 component subunit alpha n=1 Tax=Neorickettsia sp. 179522 TaxID=1714371 RepID=UPI00079A8823|nr:pyruvate dehydrogenase (acetyl-transferring) E1 component subunit alpha [Neorickettsia sp. 179522]KYH12762.1 pyruvate dehydrogenase (acetyl-transferring) E1 component subunit alpha [Neorickettsia sp. 179522]